MLAAAGVRPRGRCKRPADEQNEARKHEDVAESLQLARNQRRHVPHLCAPHFEQQDDRAGNEHHRQQEVRHDDRPTEIALHREVPERRLQQRAEKHCEGKALHPARESERAPRADPPEQRHEDHSSSDHPVPELDEGVVVLRGQWMSGLAAGPVTAAEPRIRQAYRRAGADDQPQREDLERRHAQELSRRQRKAAEPRV